MCNFDRMSEYANNLVFLADGTEKGDHSKHGTVALVERQDHGYKGGVRSSIRDAPKVRHPGCKGRVRSSDSDVSELRVARHPAFSADGTEKGEHRVNAIVEQQRLFSNALAAKNLRVNVASKRKGESDHEEVIRETSGQSHHRNKGHKEFKRPEGMSERFLRAVEEVLVLNDRVT